MTTIYMDQPDDPGPWWWRRTLEHPAIVIEVILARDGKLEYESFYEGEMWPAPCSNLGGLWARAIPPGPNADRDAADLAALRQLEQMHALPLGEPAKLVGWSVTSWGNGHRCVLDPAAECDAIEPKGYGNTLAEAVADAVRALGG